jgi:hypothetical protein
VRDGAAALSPDSGDVSGIARRGRTRLIDKIKEEFDEV